VRERGSSTFAARLRSTDRSSPGPHAIGLGFVTRIERDGVAAVVEVIAGPHRLVSVMTAEAVEELNLEVGDEAVCVVKATNGIVEIPSATETRA
jgi:molybdopterin-binding protein